MVNPRPETQHSEQCGTSLQHPFWVGCPNPKPYTHHPEPYLVAYFWASPICLCSIQLSDLCRNCLATSLDTPSVVQPFFPRYHRSVGLRVQGVDLKSKDPFKSFCKVPNNLKPLNPKLSRSSSAPSLCWKHLP